jgi:aspartate aminotransferase/aminotransferase
MLAEVLEHRPESVDDDPVISAFAASFPSSGIREMMRLAANLDDVIHLEVGQPSFVTPSHIIAAAGDALARGATGYTPTAGVPALRDAVAERASGRWGRNVTSSEVLIGCGAVGALATAVLATVAEGDEILLPDPGWPNYRSIAMLSRADIRFYPLRPEQGFIPDPDELARLVTTRTKALIINTPGNPTGAVFPEEVVGALAELARRRGFTLISDEIYEDLVFDLPHTSAAREDDQVIYISGWSKSFAMTGWRVGLAIAPPAVISTMEKLQEPLVACAPAVSQAAALAALHGPQECIDEMKVTYRRRRDEISQRLAPAELLWTEPQGAFYALVNLSEVGLTGDELSRELLNQVGVATAPGSTFGQSCQSSVRISFAASDLEVVEGCERILAFREQKMADGAAPAPVYAKESDVQGV